MLEIAVVTVVGGVLWGAGVEYIRRISTRSNP